MDKRYTGQELIERWEITTFELLELIRKKDLQPFTASGRVVSDSSLRLEWAKCGSQYLVGRTTPESLSDRPFSHIVEIDGHKIAKPDNEVLRPFTLPGDENEAEKLLDEIKQFRFKEKDVDGIEKKIGTSKKPPTGMEISRKSKWSRGCDVFQQHGLFPADLREAIKGGKLTAYDRKGRRVYYLDPCKKWRLPFEPVTNAGVYKALIDRHIFQGIFFKDDDIATFLAMNSNASDSVKTSSQQEISANLPVLREVQIYKAEARDMARKYIEKCTQEGKLPRIVEAKKELKLYFGKTGYTDQTYHDWIKDIFPPESRKPGRPPKTQD